MTPTPLPPFEPLHHHIGHGGHASTQPKRDDPLKLKESHDQYLPLQRHHGNKDKGNSAISRTIYQGGEASYEGSLNREALDTAEQEFDPEREEVAMPSSLSVQEEPKVERPLARSRTLIQFQTPLSEITQPQPQSQPQSPVVTGKYFGTDVKHHTNADMEVPNFDLSLREVMEPHIAKARKKREHAWNKLHDSLSTDDCSAISVAALYPALRTERPFLFDENTYPMHQILADTLGVPDLAFLHESEVSDKLNLLKPMLDEGRRQRFHECYERFVVHFCIPLLHQLAMSSTQTLFDSKASTAAAAAATSHVTYRYQAFPCLRIVRPGEFSIGPHCDTAYGHSVCSLNFHIPLTPVYGTNALYTESHPGREDWHPLQAKAPGIGFLFDGARCLHFTLENTTPHTRVSIDFRMAIYREGVCSPDLLRDCYSEQGGYYDEAVIHLDATAGFPLVVKKRNGPLLNPDKRMGFPFTKKSTKK